MTASRTRVGASGRDRPCSQLRSVAGGNPNFVANCAWLSPILCRTLRTSVSGTWTSATRTRLFSPGVHATACSSPSMIRLPTVGRLLGARFLAAVTFLPRSFCFMLSFRACPDIPSPTSGRVSPSRFVRLCSSWPSRSPRKLPARIQATARCGSNRLLAPPRLPLPGSAHRSFRTPPVSGIRSPARRIRRYECDQLELL
jgi:hypothetical protein